MKKSQRKRERRMAVRIEHRKRRKLRKQSVAGPSRESTQAQHDRLRSHAPPVDKFDILERVDPLAGLRNALRSIGDERGDWAGIPMPLDGERLIVEPKYPNADKLSQIGAKPETDEDDGITIRNSFWSTRLRGEIYIFEEYGKIQCVTRERFHSIHHAMHTLGCQEAWGIEQESNAIQTLAGLLSHRQFKQYLLTGMFLETSKRSGVIYLFRRLRPTVAISTRMAADDTDPNGCRMLAALCMHPIAYYEGSWAGAMCPTDDVIAHLMLMRGDEHMFWKRSNQHPPHRPEAGL